jgi:hypothetical protein
LFVQDNINQERLAKIPERGKLFKAKDTGEEPFIELLRHCIAPKELQLKVGAQVMLLQVCHSFFLNQTCIGFFIRLFCTF